MAGAVLALAAAFAVTVQTGQPVVGALLLPVGFSLLHLVGSDPLTGVSTPVPLALIDRRPGVTVRPMLRDRGPVLPGDPAGAVTVAVMMAVVVTSGLSTPPDAVGQRLGETGVARTLGYDEHGGAGMLTLLVRAVLWSWTVSTGVVAAMTSTSVPGKVVAMRMPILLLSSTGFEHSIVTAFLFPSGPILGGGFSIGDHPVWELPTVAGLVGGLTFVGLALYAAHARTGARRQPSIELPSTAAPKERVTAR